LSLLAAPEHATRIIAPIAKIAASIAQIGFAGFFASLSYLLYYKGMNLNGVSKGMALNSTFSLWSVVLSVIFLSTPLTVTLLIGVVIVTISVIGLSFSE